MSFAARIQNSGKTGFASLQAKLRLIAPGALICAVIAAAATFLSEHYGAPVMLMALLLGMALNFLAAEPAAKSGVEFVSRTVLRAGVALLGLRISFEQVAALGWKPAALVVGAVAATIIASAFAARALSFQRSFGVLTGGATAICGVSAALAIAQTLPAHPEKERATTFTVIGVSTLSTIAMVVYPMISAALGHDDRTAGIFIGATIHDVAQVVGAGYSISPEAGDAATVIKLLRVAMLLPVIVAIGVLSRSRQITSEGARPPLLPWFAIGFIVLAAVNSAADLPKFIATGGPALAQWCLIAAIAAIGIKTHLKDLVSVGVKPIALMVGETAFLAALVLALLPLMR